MLSIVIVNFNTRDLLLGCLDSIGNFLDKSGYEVLVVDNNSSDGSVEAVRRSYNWVKLIENRENLGFGRANNIGASQANGDYLFFLNSDTLLIDNGIRKVMEFMEKHKKIGAVGPKLVLADGKTQQESAFGPEPTLGHLLMREMNSEAKLENGYARVGWVTGAALLVRKRLFEKIGGFDERFFMYYEDVDLCRQIRRNGFEVVWFPSVKIIHIGGKSFTTGWNKKKSYYDNQALYFDKYHGKIQLYLLKLLRIPMVLKNYLKLQGWKSGKY